MVDVVAVSMVGGAQLPAVWRCSVNLPELWSSTPLADQAVQPHRPGYLRLDNAYVLIEGHPAV